MGSDPNRPVWIIGTGGHARVVLDLARSAGRIVNAFIEPAADRDTGETPAFTDGFTVLRGLDTLADLESPAVAVAIGDNAHRRESTEEAERYGAVSSTLIHRSALVEDSALLDAGAQVCIGAVVGSGALIGRGAIVNSGAIVEHECAVGDFAHVCPGAVLAGRVTVGPGAFIGLGARVIQGVTIGDGAVVGAGAVVLDDVPAGVTVVGVPAKAR